MYGEIASDLLRELKNAKWLPIYNEGSMRKVVREIEALYKMILKTLQTHKYKVDDQTLACGLVVHHQSLLRNKRCGLAYLNHRTEKLAALWWQTGTVLPVEVKEDVLSPNEVVFFEGYDKLMGQYMSEIGLDLTQEQHPPKDLFVEVRVLKDHGEIQTDSGAVKLDKNTNHFMRRSDCELLIRQGVLMLTNDS